MRPFQIQNDVHLYHRVKFIHKSDRRLTSRTDGKIRHLSLMVRTPDFQSGNAGFKSRRCHHILRGWSNSSSSGSYPEDAVQIGRSQRRHLAASSWRRRVALMPRKELQNEILWFIIVWCRRLEGTIVFYITPLYKKLFLTGVFDKTCVLSFWSPFFWCSFLNCVFCFLSFTQVLIFYPSVLYRYFL